MTEQELLLSQLAEKYPEEEKLWQDYLNKYGVMETLTRLRQKNADGGRGALDHRFIEWIKKREKEYYTEKIGILLRKGKLISKRTLYGMVYKILEWEGCYVRGKSGKPNRISYQKFCSKDMFNLKDEFNNSNNCRKVLAQKNYSYNYYLDLKLKSGENNREPKSKYDLWLVFKELREDIIKELHLN